MGLKDLFKESPEKQAQRLETERKLQQENTIYEALKQILVFPCNKQEFEELVGYECFLIDTGIKQKGLFYINDGQTLPLKQYSADFRKRMVDEGLAGIINAVPRSWYRIGDDKAFYGLPVGKK